jgi:hypothetical protein
LPAYDTRLNASWNKYSELSFSIDRQYTDVITGKTIIHPLFDKAEGLRKVYAENIGYFIIQDPDTTYADKDSKSLSCFSDEYETGTKYLENFRINTGGDDSVEVMYNESRHGAEYAVNEDDRYELAPIGESNFDKYESYYIKAYTDNDSYVYQQIQIADASKYAEYQGETVETTLYKKKYLNVHFYWPTKPELSLLHLVFKKIPGWEIGDVDASLWRKERKFDEDRVAVYDFLMNKVSGTFKCVIEWDTLTNRVNFYEEEEDGITEDNTIQTRFNTDIYITRENLANEINVRYSSDDIKTKLKVTGSDDLSIRDVNLGKNHIINLDFYHNDDWMERDLKDAYSDYLKTVEKYSPLYSEAVSARAGAYNRWNDLMHAVPEGGNVVLIGDPFEKLYCIHTPINTAYTKEVITNLSTLENLYSDEKCHDEDLINKQDLKNDDAFIVQGYQFKYQDGKFVYVRDIIGRDNDANGKPIDGTAKQSLIKKLNSYHVNEDVNGNQPDNILLRLKDKDSSTVTIRIYAKPAVINSYEPNKKYYGYNGDSYIYLKNVLSTDSFQQYQGIYNGVLYTNTEDYQIRFETSNKTTGYSDKVDVNFIHWLKGDMTTDADKSIMPVDLKAYTVSYIGTMGAYFVLTKDETIPTNLEDYGVMLLREKQETYTTLFQVQTEEMYSQEKYQCTISDKEPQGSIPDGARWLDSSSNPLKLYAYQDKKWQLSSFTTDDQYNYENYQRYADNYNKLLAVQEVLAKKEAEAEYCLDGYAVPDMRISLDYVRATSYNPDVEYYVENDGVMEKANPQPQTEDDFKYQIYYISHSDFIPPNYMSSDEKKLENVLLGAAKKHFPKYIYNLATKYTDETFYYVNNNGNMEPADPQPTSSNFDQHKYYTRYEHDITQVLSMDNNLPLCTFKSNAYRDKYVVANQYDENLIYYVENSNDGKKEANPQPTKDNFADNTYYTLDKEYIFAVYLKNKIPHVAFASSVGVYQAKMDYYSRLTDFENAFTEDQWMRLSPLVREDEFTDNNFLLTGYESEEERMEICQELMTTASKELKTLSQPSLEFSMNMGNILALPEFSALTSQFKLGNFLRIELRPGLVKRVRLLDADLDFDDLSNFSCQFGNLVTTQDQIDLHAELMKQAVQAGKQVAASASNWQRAVDKSNKLEQDIANGLQNAALEVGKASGQSIVWNEYGIWGRKLVDGTTDQYEPEQFRIINNKLVFSNDGFKTSKAVFGSYTINGETRWGPLAEYVTADTIEGKFITGGSIEIGTGDNKFIVNEDGSVEIRSNGVEKYAVKSAIDEINNAYQYSVELSYDGSTVFSSTDAHTIITALVKDFGSDITHKIPVNSTFKWFKNGVLHKTTTISTTNKPQEGVINTNINNLTANQINITHTDIEGNSFFSCQVDFDETKIEKGE